MAADANYLATYSATRVILPNQSHLEMMTHVIPIGQSLLNTTTHVIPITQSLLGATTPFEVTSDPIEPTNVAILEMTRFVVQRVIVPVVVVIGVVGNIISMVVLSRPSMTSSTNSYLFGLAIADVLYLLCSLTLSLKHYPSIKNRDAFSLWYPYGKVLSDLFANGSVWFTVSFTAERFIAVRYPVRGRSMCTPTRAKIVLTVVSLVTLLLTFPEFFESKIIYVTVDNVTRVDSVDSDLAKSDAYLKGYYWFFITSFTIIPLIALSTLNSLLIRSVYEAQKLRSTISSSVSQIMTSSRRHSEQQKITLLLIVMVIVFIVCQTPYACLLVYSSNIVPTREKITDFRIAANFTNLLIQINAAVNIFLYVVFSSRFRKTFSRTFCLPYPPQPRYCFQATETSGVGRSIHTPTGSRSPFLGSSHENILLRVETNRHYRDVVKITLMKPKPKRRKGVCCGEAPCEIDVSPPNGISMTVLSQNRLHVNTNISRARSPTRHTN